MEAEWLMRSVALIADARDSVESCPGKRGQDSRRNRGGEGDAPKAALLPNQKQNALLLVGTI